MTKLNRREAKQVDRMVDLGTMDPSDVRNALLSRALILASLPYRRIDANYQDVLIPLGNGERLGVRFSAANHAVGLPYGDDALLLDLLASEARRTGYPEITFQSAGELARFAGSTKGGMTTKEILGRLRRLRSLTLGVTWTGDIGELSAIYRVFSQCFLPTERDAKREAAGERALLPFYIRFSPEFMAELQRYRAMPREILLTFHGSPTEYALAKWIVDRVATARSASVIPWEDLARERGSREKQIRRYRAKVQATITKLLAGIPELHLAVRVEPAGLWIGPLPEALGGGK